MNILKKKPFTKVLCKRSLTSGEPFWWNDQGSVAPPDHPKRHKREDHMFIEGTWYEITKWKDNAFWVIDSQGNPHAHTVYSDKDKLDFPDHCDLYGPRDYAKWFYTPDELEEVEAGTYNPSYKVKNAIKVLVGNYHWVKQTEVNGGDWIIALCHQKNAAHGKHYWMIPGREYVKTDWDFAEIGEQVDSMKTQKKNKERIETLEELNDTIIPFIDSLKFEGTEEEKWHAPAAYHKPFILEAVKVYSKKMWDSIADSPFFGKADK